MRGTTMLGSATGIHASGHSSNTLRESALLVLSSMRTHLISFLRRFRVDVPIPRKRRVRAVRCKLRRALVRAWKRLAITLHRPSQNDDGVLDDFVLVEWESPSSP